MHSSLDIRALMALAQTCTQLRRLADDRYFWQKRYLTEFPNGFFAFQYYDEEAKRIQGRGTDEEGEGEGEDNSVRGSFE